MSNPAIKAASFRRRSPVPVDQCGAVLASKIIADKWILLIIREAFYGVVRYEDMRADIEIPRSVLTQRLKYLVEHGIMERISYQETGARRRSAYVLSSKGKDLALTILALMQWGDTHLKDGVAAIDIIDRKSGATLKVGLVDKEQEIVPLSDVTIKLTKQSKAIV